MDWVGVLESDSMDWVGVLESDSMDWVEFDVSAAEDGESVPCEVLFFKAVK